MLPQSLHRVAFSRQLVAESFAKFDIPKRKIVVDFSSPNIAKTFHMGNLRSTLYGNFVQKLCKSAGHEVISINYLGDWGNQFALLALYWLAVLDGREGRAQRPSAEEWAGMGTRERISTLTGAYVAANRMAKLNGAFQKRARELFVNMERAKLDGEQSLSPETEQAMQLWAEWKGTSTDYLHDFYAQFGIAFDEWDAESAQVGEASRLVEEMIQQGMCRLSVPDAASTDPNSCWVVHSEGGQPTSPPTSSSSLAQPISSSSSAQPTSSSSSTRPTTSSSSGHRIVALRRGDGASLYLSRDLAAIYTRHARHQADRYLYVVDQAQAGHFANLKQLLRVRGDEELAERVEHFAYGHIVGLSTREGKNDSVDFLIEQGQREAGVYLDASHTKRSGDAERAELCRALARSQLVFELVSRLRSASFTFSYKRAFSPQGSNALILQEKYSRLNSLELANHEHMDRLRALDQNALAMMRVELGENGQKLAKKILEFDTVLNNSLERMEPCPVSMYLIRLSNLIGRTLPTLRVLGEPLKLALPRMLLFSAAKNVLGQGMRLVGIEPVERM